MRRDDGPSVPGDAGMSLAEVLVAMAVAAVVMALTTTGVVQMYRSSTRAEVLSGEMIQLQTVFQQLDRSVRYATAISDPSTAPTIGGGWYVEWSSAVSGVPMCTQLRLDSASGLLQRRSRAAGTSAGTWVTVASFRFGTRPFELQPASSGGFPHQRLNVDVTVRLPGDGVNSARRPTFSFTALNTSLTTVSSCVCADLGRP